MILAVSLWVLAASQDACAADDLPSSGLPTAALTIKGKAILAEVANREESREKGMRFRKTLDPDAGMLFVFRDPQLLDFWMKDCSIPLDIAFLDGKGTILNILEMEPLTERHYSSFGPCRFALEMNRGWFAANGVKSGDRVAGVLAALPDNEPAEKIPPYLDAKRAAWGEAQLRQMLKDRPAMAPYVREGDEVWNWAVRAFAGEGFPLGIQWDPKDPQPLWDAMSQGPDGARNKPGWIKITQNYAHTVTPVSIEGKPKSGLMLWGNFFIEIFNTKNSPRATKVDERALAGHIGREGYISERYLTEYGTLEDAHQFFQEVWVPHCQKLGLPPEDAELSAYYGKGMKPVLVEDYFDGLLDPHDFHRKVFGDIYDKGYKEKTKIMDERGKAMTKEMDSLPPPP